MAQARIPVKTTLFLGMMYHDETLVAGALADFCTLVEGEVLAEVGPVLFSSLSSYYNSEMGGEVWKRYYIFRTPFDREKLAHLKVATNALEERYSVGYGRTINFDPGYVAVDKLVLASAKDYFHRIAIGKGIFAEVTLHFTEKGPRSFSWTYADYQLLEVQNLLLQAREYARGLKE